MAKAEADALIEEMFQADTDNSGSLSKEEIKAYMKAKQHSEITDADVDSFMQQIDENQDDQISRVEVTKCIYGVFGVE